MTLPCLWCSESVGHEEACPALYGAFGLDHSLSESLLRISESKSSMVRLSASQYRAGVPLTDEAAASAAAESA